MCVCVVREEGSSILFERERERERERESEREREGGRNFAEVRERCCGYGSFRLRWLLWMRLCPAAAM